eukprot:1540447-Alexandrium_andersonii.AAC.1
MCIRDSNRRASTTLAARLPARAGQPPCWELAWLAASVGRPRSVLDPLPRKVVDESTAPRHD